MKAITIKCPDCGAKLKATPGVTECKYCGTSVHVGGEGTAEDAAAPPTAPARKPAVGPAVRPEVGSAPQHPPVSPSAVVFVVAMLLLLISLIGHHFSTSSRAEPGEIRRGVLPASRPEAAASTPKAPTYAWESRVPFVRDFSGDGVDDVLGFVQGSDKGYRIAPFSGVDGTRMWMSDVIPGLEGGGHPGVHLGENVVLASGPAGEVTCYSSRDGGTLWTLKMADVVKRVGEIDSKTLVLELADKSLVRVDQNRGTIQPAEDGDTEAAAWLGTTGDSSKRLGNHLLRLSPFSEVPLPDRDAFEDVSWDFAAVDFDGKFAVVAGKRDSGTRIPMLVRYELGEAVEGSRKAPPATELWRTVVAGVEPLKSRIPLGTPTFFHAGDSYCVAGYQRQDMRAGQISRFACFQMSDGARTFDLEIPDESIVHTISVVGDRVYLTTWKGLSVLDAASGSVLYTVTES